MAQKLFIACLMNSFWANICRALDMEDWISDERFDTLPKRRDARALVNERISATTSQYSVDQLVEIFTANQVPHAPILGIRAALAQPQAMARGMVVEVEHATLGTIPIVGRSITFPGESQPAPSAPPVLGQHTDAVLSGLLELSPERIAELRAAKVVS